MMNDGSEKTLPRVEGSETFTSAKLVDLVDQVDVDLVEVPELLDQVAEVDLVEVDLVEVDLVDVDQAGPELLDQAGGGRPPAAI